ncbi:single-stranded-DNA-specific exonuclease [Paenibacillus phyllosphaerae]|uniref:Single-stranded-DNA-specific exonuclease RecJ n=1 Tax=Paenibacillus phyllosphaerae TaxID=274593 RepID=A0A7W5AW74_9BACL|nr:single-stranded-DNA-specific exonuclease RecJ [Paenibacillus phyllosphaerae]MBB3109935.1 single-stranded-DNA-specific exonuclease [Paenibacillus phyllosphaerae]
MIHAKTRWNVTRLGHENEELAAQLSKQLKLPALVARLLVQRGIRSAEEAHLFLNAGEDRLHDPYLLKDMDKAVARIRKAVEHDERVRIYGDYDADGVSSTTLMTYLFRELGLKFDHYIPHRTIEGYGLNDRAIDMAHELGVTLIVTVDTGISAVEQIAYANSLGIDVVVTDHHEPPAILPQALALVNPKQEDCPYPFKGLAGVGVAFKLATAMLERPPIEWTDIYALGTIADLMPLTDENRILVRYGLEQLKRTEKPGFRALADVAGIDLTRVTSTNIAFGMAPRINAAGRLAHANQSVELLVADNDDSALASAHALDALNKERQQVVEAIVEEAKAQWADKCLAAQEAGKPEPSVIVLAGEGWNAGVVGIVASKFIEWHYKPTLILGIDAQTGMCKGSARSIDGYDLHAALTECDALLDHYGGHQAAAGMSLHRDQLEAFETRLCELADQWLQPDDWIPKTTIDLACTIEEATIEVLEQLALLEPFGIGNSPPKLLLQQTDIADKRTMGKESKHLKLTLGGGKRLLDAVGFGLGHLAERLTEGAQAQLVGELAMNEWNGQRKAQFMIHDLSVAQLRLVDLRAEQSPMQAFRQLIESNKIDPAQALIVAASSAWREAGIEAAGDAASQLVIASYEDWQQANIEGKRTLLLLGKPSLRELAGIIRSCVRLESVYALYSQPKSTGRQGRAASGGTGMPGREHFAQLYQTLRRVGPLQDSERSQRLAVMLDWPVETVEFMVNVFIELELVEIRSDMLTLPVSPAKRELTESPAYRKRMHAAEEEKILYASAKELGAWLTEQTQASRTQHHMIEQEEGVAVS